MAVNAELMDSRLVLTFEDGVDEVGNPVYRTKSFNNVKTTATEEQLHGVATALEPLQQRVLFSIERDDEFLIYES
ncbi:DUF1659 domain-containing protein [Halobacillus litoralis]|uniref:DUF1659 domain-containing protein n=1 Tax=Halobacillus litoralis TaxID=45668 RepID=UPI001CD36ED4|nr:DUF1659 domain-containing protein [Halobacillus litoralis]MCA0970774.1 DUF1659 domain-containing protein [Halobacillus litoralis]